METELCLTPGEVKQAKHGAREWLALLEEATIRSPSKALGASLIKRGNGSSSGCACSWLFLVALWPQMWGTEDE